MSVKKKWYVLTAVLLSVAMIVAVVTIGCKKKGSSTGSSAEQPSMTGLAEKTAETSRAIESTAKETARSMEKMTEQTICPVMGGPVKKDIYTEYKGQKVYFCCPSCKQTFEKDPEKYISKLPQFQQ